MLCQAQRVKLLGKNGLTWVVTQNIQLLGTLARPCALFGSKGQKCPTFLESLLLSTMLGVLNRNPVLSLTMYRLTTAARVSKICRRSSKNGVTDMAMDAFHLRCNTGEYPRVWVPVGFSKAITRTQRVFRHGYPSPAGDTTGYPHAWVPAGESGYHYQYPWYPWYPLVQV